MYSIRLSFTIITGETQAIEKEIKKMGGYRNRHSYKWTIQGAHKRKLMKLAKENDLFLDVVVLNFTL